MAIKIRQMWAERGKISLVKCTLLPTLHGSCRQEGKIDMIVNEDDLRMHMPVRTIKNWHSAQKERLVQ